MHGKDGKTYGYRAGHHIAWPLRGANSERSRLSSDLYEDTGRVANQNALTDAVALLEARAGKNAAEVHHRVARTGSGVVIDLGRQDGQLVQGVARHLARSVRGEAQGQTAGVSAVGYVVIVLAFGVALGTIGSLRHDHAGSSWTRTWQPWSAGVSLVLLGLGFGLISQRASFALPAVVLGVVLPFAWTLDSKSRNRP